MSHPHECRNGHHCRQATRTDDGEKVGAIIERAGLCPPCERHAFAAIQQLADDWIALNRAAGNVFSRLDSSPRVNQTPDRHKVPVRLEALDLATVIDQEVGRWAWRVAPHVKDAMPGNAQARVARHVTALTRHLGTLADLPAQSVGIPSVGDNGHVQWTRTPLDGADALMRLERLHRAANRLLGRTGAVTWLREPCQDCGRRTLTSNPYENLISCAHCGHAWAADEFDALTNMEAAA
ncbi:hypothetical protein A5780_19295 [Nocardia sp. 852002-20019_SCH5090214]|uniref:hypothetical protein n=1 Tax=Nocardia sp. 852002-20019_SCH5090214 TaxID=1834087 RepID=UPI0007FB8197|nr:hypothetical protein [Nocardia sp. 852002-20019_SCH5090214]OBA62205.1 hypothetical protein A5780_19295 [Nocardia sp. 852002-20019_SCH5090214]